MSPDILYPIAGLGIIAVVTLTWLIGWKASRPLPNKDALIAHYKQDHNHDAISEIAYTSDHKAALVSLQNTSDMGLISRFGDKIVTRHLSQSSVAHVVLDARSVMIRFKDMTWPKTVLTFDTPAQAAHWSAILIKVQEG